jgi:hypothetical protein
VSGLSDRGRGSRPTPRGPCRGRTARGRPR